MNSFKFKFGKRIKELRKSKGLTQEQVAELINIEPPNFSKIECGMHFPQPEKIEKIATVLGVEIKDLFDFEHFQQKKILLDDINTLLSQFDTKKIELVYKFVVSLKLY